MLYKFEPYCELVMGEMVWAIKIIRASKLLQYLTLMRVGQMT